MNKGKPNNSGPLKSWEDLIKREGTPEEKRALLKKNPKILYSNPANFRKDFWGIFISPEIIEQEKENFKDQLESINKNELSIPTKVKGRILKDVRIYFQMNNNRIEAKMEQMKNLLFVYQSKHPDYEYSSAWVRIGYPLVTSFALSEAYAFFVYFMDYVFPNKYHSPKNRCLEKNINLRVLSMYCELLSGNLATSLTAQMTLGGSAPGGNTPNANNKGNIVKDNSPYVIFIKKIGEFYITSLFSTILDVETQLKIFDFLIIENFKFAIKLTLKLIEKKVPKAIQVIKKESKKPGSNPKDGPSTEELLVAGNAAMVIFKEKIKGPILMKLIQSFIDDDGLEKLIELNKSGFHLDSKRIEANENSITENSRIHLLRKTRAMLLDNKFSMDLNYIRGVWKEFEAIQNKGDGEISIPNLYKLVMDKKKPFKWDTKATASFVSSVDTGGGKETINIKDIQLILTVLSNSMLEEKLKVLFEIFDKDKTQSLDSDEIVSLLETIETKIDERVKIFSTNSEEFVEHMERGPDGHVSLENFIQAVTTSEECQSIRDMFSALEVTATMARSTFLDIHSPLGPSPNSSFHSNNGGMDFGKDDDEMLANSEELSEVDDEPEEGEDNKGDPSGNPKTPKEHNKSVTFKDKYEKKNSHKDKSKQRKSKAQSGEGENDAMRKCRVCTQNKCTIF